MSSSIRRGPEGEVIKQIIRDRRLTPEEAEKYRRIREQVEQDLPDLIAQHHQARMATRTSLARDRSRSD